ncbi:hypothetical protein L1987_44174 [Smallanthus sonchifolius]|uniref:Uncharacterized protein n=1 Tax=Smallanthus sonchifolius TaxID=185202 RepID=A0ACB9GNQ9_9ASTR|nr:hypothetical protein L1987_44174 [Smallanthus sonchifolius]
MKRGVHSSETWQMQKSSLEERAVARGVRVVAMAPAAVAACTLAEDLYAAGHEGVGSVTMRMKMLVT